MILVLYLFLGLGAAAAWVVAAYSAISVFRMSPKGEKVSNYFRLGRLKFTDLEDRLGPGAMPDLRRYRVALFSFFGFCGCILAIAALVALIESNGN
jgi:hypothetical protein